MAINVKSDLGSLEVVDATVHSKSPWLFVPTLSLSRGVAVGLTMGMSTALFKSLGMPNDFIGFLTLLMLPASFQPLWAPIIDSYWRKREWALTGNLCLALALAVLSLGLFASSIPVHWLVLGFVVIALSHAVIDVSADAFFICAVNRKEQSAFVGIKTAFMRLAGLSIAAVSFTAGTLGDKWGNLRQGWAVAVGCYAVCIGGLWLYNRYSYPYPEKDQPVRETGKSIPWGEVWKSFMRIPRIWVVLAFLFVYRFGESLIFRMEGAFMLDSEEAGGLAIKLQDGALLGPFIMASTITGGILGGFAIKRFGAQKVILPFVLCMTVPNLLYVVLAYNPMYDGLDVGGVVIPQLIVYGLIRCVETFGYGVGFTAYIFVMVALSKDKYRGSHYAMFSGLMVLGFVVPGSLSGVIQQATDWPTLFLYSFLLGLPGIVLAFFLPIKEIELAQHEG